MEYCLLNLLKKIYKHIFFLVKTVLLLDTCVSMNIQGLPISHPAGFQVSFIHLLLVL